VQFQLQVGRNCLVCKPELLCLPPQHSLLMTRIFSGFFNHLRNELIKNYLCPRQKWCQGSTSKSLPNPYPHHLHGKSSCCVVILCLRVNFLQKRDAGRGLVAFVDVPDDNYTPEIIACRGAFDSAMRGRNPRRWYCLMAQSSRMWSLSSSLRNPLGYRTRYMRRPNCPYQFRVVNTPIWS